MPPTLQSLLDVFSNSIWTMMAVVLPILLTAMVVGLFIGILQTATSIQEQTLIFIPKILAVFMCIILMASLIGQKMLLMTTEILGHLERFIQ